MNRNDDNQRQSPIPESDSSKPMNSKQEIEQSPDAKTDQDFPGYPHYPAKDDIMDQRTGSERVDAEIERMGSTANVAGMPQRFLDGQDRHRAEQAITPQPGSGRDDLQDDLKIQMGNEADVDSDDLAALNSTDAEIGTPQNVSNEDINTDVDIPGTDMDDSNEEVGEEDEENNYYSLGGDRHQSQEEDPQSGPDRS